MKNKPTERVQKRHVKRLYNWFVTSRVMRAHQRPTHGCSAWTRLLCQCCADKCPEIRSLTLTITGIPLIGPHSFVYKYPSIRHLQTGAILKESTNSALKLGSNSGLFCRPTTVSVGIVQTPPLNLTHIHQGVLAFPYDS